MQCSRSCLTHLSLLVLGARLTHLSLLMLGAPPDALRQQLDDLSRKGFRTLVYITWGVIRVTMGVIMVIMEITGVITGLLE